MNLTSTLLLNIKAVDPFPALFHNRIYYEDPVDSCAPGWYISSQTGRVFGPFISRKDARQTLHSLTI